MDTFSIDNSAVRPLLDTIVVLATTPDNSHEVTGLPVDVTVNEISGGTDAVVSLQKLGTNYGQLSSAFAVDATGQVLQSHYSLKNGKLHQSFNADEPVNFPVFLAPSYVRAGNAEDASMAMTYRATLTDTSLTGDSTGGVSSGGLQSMRLAGISVPSNYVYNPNMSPKALHDYCTSSPDSFGNADFRGSCARHDLCIQAGLGLPLWDRKARRAGCDTGLYNNLLASCVMGNNNIVTQSTCAGVAKTYYQAVTVATWVVG